MQRKAPSATRDHLISMGNVVFKTNHHKGAILGTNESNGEKQLLHTKANNASLRVPKKCYFLLVAVVAVSDRK
jgi:hypothetical protein